MKHVSPPKKKKRVRVQVTCLCGVYPFPHRIGGGKCTGRNWVASYINMVSECCNQCNCKNTGESGAGGERAGTCDVYEGLESIKLCEGYIDFLHSQTPMRLPMDEAQYFEWLYGGMNDE